MTVQYIRIGKRYFMPVKFTSGGVRVIGRCSQRAFVERVNRSVRRAVQKGCLPSSGAKYMEHSNAEGGLVRHRGVRGRS